ncbi:YtxH domain-containing protein [Streptococcus caballi]|uniref:YtxH domain-containing protein n=1 Tax=Streptococcus caballi TaxID=439220 RepID=UPI0003781E30|nr:YtxH domain-containing protein [Streptococcus caballi]
MNKFLKTLIVGAASGAAAAYFLTSEKGKDVQRRVSKAYEAYKDDPEDFHQAAKEKATEYSQLAVDTFNNYKEKFESGDLTVDDFVTTVKEKGGEAFGYVADKVSEATARYSDSDEVTVDLTPDKDSAENAAEPEEQEDIIINYSDHQEPDQSENE